MEDSMSKVEFIFKTEPDGNIVEMVEQGTIDYDFWGRLDIQIDGQSFFKNFRTEYYDKYYEGTSTISNQGITMPVFPMLEAIVKATSTLTKEKVVVIKEYTGQIGKSIVCLSEGQGESVVFAIRKEGEKYTWFDGEKVVVQKEMPVSNYNIVKKEYFINGCVQSVRNYLASLIDKYPKLMGISHFREFANGIGLYI
jgi:hypothetical protein